MTILEKIADWLTGGALSGARSGRQSNWDLAQQHWNLATDRAMLVQRIEAHLRHAEDEARATAKKHREQMDQIRAELSELIDARPLSEQAKQLRAIRALTKG